MELGNAKIGFISLIPDTGHVIPLLRIASSFREKGYDVTIYLPDENEDIAKQYQVRVKTFGRILENINKDFYIELSKRSLFYNAFSNYVDVNRNLIHPLTVNLSRHLETIKELVEKDNPSLLIADNFIFNNYHLHLAALIKSPLVLHSSSGNYRFQHQHFIYRFGFSKIPKGLQDWIVTKGFIQNIRFEYQEINEKKFFMSFFNDTVKKLFPGICPDTTKPILIATGIPFIEKEKIRTKISNDDYLLFPALKDNRKVEIDSQLLSWLEQDPDKSVVYVSFGTMLKGNIRLMHSIMKGIKDLKVRVLWILSKEDQQTIKNMGLPAGFRLESFVPQPQILAMDCIRCFITHGGAGGMQEGLLAGKPMLCIPMMTDQPFNSSVAEKLGIGLKIWKQLASPGTIRNKVKKLLKDKKYITKAKELKKELNLMDGGLDIIQYLKKLKLI